MSDTQIAEKKNELVRFVDNSGLDTTKAKYLLEQFQDYFEIASDWERKARAITVTDESQIAEMKMAREGRLFLRAKRIDVENARKKLKEQSLRESKAIDGIANILKAVIVPIEQYLDDQEHYAENKRKAEEEARRIEAEKLLREKEERERIEREAEQQRIREENERLRKEAEAREAEIRKEREAAEAKAKREREAAEAKARAEREAHEKVLAEERRKASAEAERARVEAAANAKREREAYEAKLAEQRRLASMVTCPECGHRFSTDGISA
jgi:hypothetical protein